MQLLIVGVLVRQYMLDILICVLIYLLYALTIRTSHWYGLMLAQSQHSIANASTVPEHALLQVRPLTWHMSSLLGVLRTHIDVIDHRRFTVAGDKGQAYLPISPARFDLAAIDTSCPASLTCDGAGSPLEP